MALPPAHRDLTRIVLGVLVIGGLLAGVFLVLRPFLPAIMWATMIVVATWPLMCRVQRLLWGRRSLAVAAMLLAMLLVVFVPLALVASAAYEQVGRLATVKVTELRFPQPPAWLEGVPLVGARVVVEWRSLAASSTDALTTRAAPYVGTVAAWLAGQAGSAGAFGVHLLFTLLICGVLYATGEKAARGVRRFARRLHGDQGENVVLLAGASVRAVALGIVGTAIAQTALGALGLVAAGIPHVALITSAMFVLCIAQLGPLLPLLGSAAWLWLAGEHVTAMLLMAWAVGVAMLDNVLRPLLIRRGADLPLLLIMVGVIGGLLSMGLVGLFVGPVLLAVAYRLVGAWIDEQDDVPAPGEAPPKAPLRSPAAD